MPDHSARPSGLLPTGPTLLTLDDLALVRVGGADAEDFLQGQFSNDLHALAPGRAQLQAYCTPKGRALGVLRLVRDDEGFWMILPTEVSEKLLPRLKMFVLRAKVDLDLAPETTLTGLLNGSELAANAGAAAAVVDGACPRTLLIGASGTGSALAKNPGFDHESGSKAWRLADILSGIPQVYAETMEAFLPQAINLDLVDGVSFKKGCYPGQEIVARLRYLGKLKQRMIVAQLTDVGAITPGDSLFTADRPDQKAGQVVDAVSTDGGHTVLTAVVPAAHVEEGDLHYGTADGPALTRLELPYPLP